MEALFLASASNTRVIESVTRQYVLMPEIAPSSLRLLPAAWSWPITAWQPALSNAYI
jgi:hypothetical protein